MISPQRERYCRAMGRECTIWRYVTVFTGYIDTHLVFYYIVGLKRQHWVQVLIKTTSELSSKFLSSLDASVLIFNMLEYPLSSIILTCAHFMKLHLPFSLSIKLITTFLGMLNSETNAQLLYFLVNSKVNITVLRVVWYFFNKKSN